MGMCLSTVNRPAKRLLQERERTERGSWKCSQLFPFPQSVYGNAFGASFSSHVGGKASGSEVKREATKGSRDKGKGLLLLPIFHGRGPASCVSLHLDL